MRETRTCGSEGGEAREGLSYLYRARYKCRDLFFGQYSVFLTKRNRLTLRPPSTSGVETPDYRMFRTTKTVGQVPVPGRKVDCNELPDKNHVTFIKGKN
jgi:hypothetical protein